MLTAHVVPAYFAVVISQPAWKEDWTPLQRGLLWTVAIASTIVPDGDVIYNVFFRGYLNHSTLWTHSLFPYLGLAGIWVILFWFKWLDYWRMLLGLVVIGGFSHLLLDVIAHNTPLFYPLSYKMIGAAPLRITTGRSIHYITHELFLLEGCLWAALLYHWSAKHFPPIKEFILAIWFIVSLAFLIFLPDLQRFVDSL